MPPAFDVVVLGDINLDLVARGRLAFAFETLTQNGCINWLPIDELPGGSGLNFARFAIAEGLRTLLIGKIGEDESGKFLLRRLQELELDAGVHVDDAAPTGRAMIMRDANDIRLLVNNVGHANVCLNRNDVDTHVQALQSCALLYVSGYCVSDRSAPRFEAAARAMELVASGRRQPPPTIVFDVVPHRIYETYDFAQFRSITRHVGVLISEVATMRRFLALGDRSEVVNEAMARDTVERLREYYPSLLLRYGPSGCDVELAWDASTGESRVVHTDHANAPDKRGFGDVLALRALREHFKLI